MSDTITLTTDDFLLYERLRSQFISTTNPSIVHVWGEDWAVTGITITENPIIYDGDPSVVETGVTRYVVKLQRLLPINLTLPVCRLILRCRFAD